jgi:serine protease Do
MSMGKLVGHLTVAVIAQMGQVALLPAAYAAPAAVQAAPATPSPSRGEASPSGKAQPPASGAGITSDSPNAGAESQNNLTRERAGVVELRVQKRTVALGMVLDGDGRIVTSLSSLGRGIGLSARYADGVSVPLRVIHSDRGWDLALVSPETPHFTKGLLASRYDPLKDAVRLRILRIDAAQKLKAAELTAPRRENLVGGDATPLAQAMTFVPALSAGDIGAPLVDENGDAVGIVSQACLPTTLDRCVPIVYAVPTSELKRFVRDGARETSAALPWLGITVASETPSIVPAARIMSVGPNSPALALGLRAGKAGDILLAVDGTPVGSAKDVADVLRRHRALDRVTLLLLAEGRYREVRVTLARYPDGAKWHSLVPGLSQSDPGF